MADEDSILPPLTEALGMTKELKRTADAMGRSITQAFASGVVHGKRFEDVLRSIGQRMIAFGLRAALRPVEFSLQSVFGSLLKGLFPSAGAPLNILPNARGHAFSAGRVTPFAAGGVIARPTYFPMRDGLGLMGEQGAEAVMPLSRGADGRLGVRANGAAAPVSVTVNISTPDADSFRRSEAQVAAALARAVARGRRSL